MMSYWEVTESKDMHFEDQLPSGSGIFRRDEFNISIDNESETLRNLGEDSFKETFQSRNGEAAEIQTYFFRDEGNNSAQGTSEGVLYLELDKSGVFKEISHDTTIEIKTIELPILSKCENVTVDNSNVPTLQIEEQDSSNEVEDYLSALDNLMTLLGEPPKKKSVWDTFDFLMKNQPLAEHIAESDRIKSIMDKPVRVDSTNQTNSKRKARRKLPFDLLEKSDQVTTAGMSIKEISAEDTSKVAKRTTNKKMVPKRVDIEYPKRQFQILDGNTKSIKILPNNNAIVAENSGHNNNISSFVKNGSSKSVPCRECPACLRHDCGDCNNCWDKTKFGGPNKLKQRCKKRACHTYTNDDRKYSESVKFAHNEYKMVQLPKGVSISVVKKPKIQTIPSLPKTHVAMNANKEFNGNFLLEAENSTRNIELSQMTMKSENSTNSTSNVEVSQMIIKSENSTNSTRNIEVSQMTMKSENSTRNIEAPQMLMNYCELCNFQTPVSQLLISHMRYYHAEESLQSSNQISKQPEAEKSNAKAIAQCVDPSLWF